MKEANVQDDLEARIIAATAIVSKLRGPTQKLINRPLIELQQRVNAGDFVAAATMDEAHRLEYEQSVRSVVEAPSAPALAETTFDYKGARFTAGLYGGKETGRILVLGNGAPLLGLEWSTIKTKYGSTLRVIWGLASAQGRGTNDPGFIRRAMPHALALYRMHVDKVIRVVGPFTYAGRLAAGLFADEIYPNNDSLERQARRAWAKHAPASIRVVAADVLPVRVVAAEELEQPGIDAYLQGLERALEKQQLVHVSSTDADGNYQRRSDWRRQGGARCREGFRLQDRRLLPERSTVGRRSNSSAISHDRSASSIVCRADEIECARSRRNAHLDNRYADTRLEANVRGSRQSEQAGAYRRYSNDATEHSHGLAETDSAEHVERGGFARIEGSRYRRSEHDFSHRRAEIRAAVTWPEPPFDEAKNHVREVAKHAQDARAPIRIVAADIRDETAGPNPSSLVVVVRIPSALARMWPKEVVAKNGEPHFTVCHLKDVREGTVHIRKLVEEVAKTHAAIPVELAKGVDFFQTDNPKEQDAPWIANKAVHPETEERLTALHWDLVGALEDAGFAPSVRDEFRAHATLAYLPEAQYTGPVPEGGFTARTIEIWHGDDVPIVIALTGTPAPLNLFKEARRPRRAPNRKRLYKPLWYLREGTNVAYAADRGADGVEVSLRPDARVLDLSATSLHKSASAPDVAALVEAVAAQAKAIQSLTVSVERLLAVNTGGYDAVRTEDRLIVLNPAALETAPARRRWLGPGKATPTAEGAVASHAPVGVGV